MHRPALLGVLLGATLCACGASGPERGGAPGVGPGASVGGAGGAVLVALPEVPADPREAALAETLERVLRERHLDGGALDDALSRRAFAVFMERLDDRKLFLLEPHVRALEAYADRMDDQIRGRDLELARKGAGVLAEQRRRVEAMVAELLAAPLDFTDDDAVETDPARLAFCSSEEALRERWRRMLELEVMLEIAKGRDPTVFSDPARWAPQEAKVRAALAATLEARFARLANPDPLEPAARFLDAIANAYDAHSRYVSPAGRSQHESQTTGTVEGVGATLADERGEVVIQELVAGGAAWSQGELAVGDVIVSIAQAGESPVGMAGVPIDRAAAMLQGPAGTQVTLTIRSASGVTKAVTLTRSVVAIEAAYSRAFILGHPARAAKVGYVYLPSFYDQGGALAADRVRNATADVRRALEVFKEQKLRGMILDLRSNRGGLILHAQHIAGLFIKKGPIYQTRSAGGAIAIEKDIHPTVAFSGELVVLVDRFSASATEVLAAALQDHRRALVVGTGPTWGKGTVQDIVDLDSQWYGAGPRDRGPLGLLVLTTQQYYRVDGASTQWRGVEPDVLLPDPAAHLIAGERSLANTLPFAKLAALEVDPHPRAWDPKALAAKSRARASAQPVFAAFEAREKILAERREATRVSLLPSKWWEDQLRVDQSLAALDTSLGAVRLEVSIVEDPLAGPWGGAGRARWRDEIARDPWIEEAVALLFDMGV